MCLKYLKIKVNLPMFMLIDNIGAIEMLDLKTGKCQTKHVDTRYHLTYAGKIGVDKSNNTR